MHNFSELLTTSTYSWPTLSKRQYCFVTYFLQSIAGRSHNVSSTQWLPGNRARDRPARLLLLAFDPRQAAQRSRAYSPQVNCYSASSSDVSPCLPGLGATQLESARRLGLFLSGRRWLRPAPDAPIQLVHLQDEPDQAAKPRIGDPALKSQQIAAVSSATCHVGQTSDRDLPEAKNVRGDNAAGRVSYSNRSSGSSAVSGDHAGSRMVSGGGHRVPRCFYIIRDDLLHPVLGGNKVRKLDALLPELAAEGATDLVTCGGAQSAHLAAVAVTAAELGLRSHLLVRGEPPKVPAGYHLVTRMYGTDVSYVSRAEYADREAMLHDRVERLRRSDPTAQVAVIAEGGGTAAALLGLVRLVHWLAYGNTNTTFGDAAKASGSTVGGVESGQMGGSASGNGGGGTSNGEGAAAATSVSAAARQRCSVRPAVTAVRRLLDPTTTPYVFVVDSGTGTTAIGMALGIALLGLPWRVLGVRLAGDLSYYRSQAEHLTSAFLDAYGAELYDDTAVLVSSNRTAAAVAPLVESTPLFARGGPRDAALKAAEALAAEAGASPVTALATEGYWKARASEARCETAEDGKAVDLDVATGIREVAGTFGGRETPGTEVAAVTAAAATATTGARAEAAPTVASAAAAGWTLPLVWVPRPVPRRFGKVLEGEIAACKEVARWCGIGLDPIYSLAAWEVCCEEAIGMAGGASPSAARIDAAAGAVTCTAAAAKGRGNAAAGQGGVNAASEDGDGNAADERDGGNAAGAGLLVARQPRVVMLHGGGGLGLHGLAQRYPEAF